MQTETAELNGKRIVVVEDDYLLASDICRELRELGATVLGPAPTPFYATQLIGQRKIDAAVLDVRLHGTTVFDVADMLNNRGVPILFATAYDRAALPNRFQHAGLIEKPLDRRKLISEIVAMTRRPAREIPHAHNPQAGFDVPRSNAQIFAQALARTMVASSA